MLRTLIVATSLLVATGCAQTMPVEKTPVATGGSKADGTVRVAYETNPHQSAIVDWDSADRNALRRCEAWGYHEAERFGGYTTNCVEFGRGLLVNGFAPGTCARQIVSIDYQCLD